MKITKWKVLQKDSSIGLLLLIMSFVTLILLVIAPTTIGIKDGPNHLTIGDDGSKTAGYWSATGEGLSVAGMVFTGIAFLAICVGWYADPTKLDERVTLTVAASATLVALVLGIAGPAYEFNVMWPNSNKGYIAGDEILVIVPCLLTMLLMVEPLIIVYNPKYQSKPEEKIQAYEKQLEKQESKQN